MGFTPKPRDEVNKMNVLEPGTYDFEVTKAVEETSKSGNPMLVVDMKCFRPDGTCAFVRDWLVNADNYMCQHKCRSFCETTGCDELNQYVVGQSGLVAVQVEETEEYGKQNRVLGYPTERKGEGPPAPASPEPASVADDDIPF